MGEKRTQERKGKKQNISRHCKCNVYAMGA